MSNATKIAPKTEDTFVFSTKAKRRLAILSTRQRERLIELIESGMDCMHDELFETAEAHEQLFGENVDMPARPNSSWYHTFLDHQDLVAFNKKNAENAVLNSAQESLLFLRFNYARHRMSELLELAHADALMLKDARELLDWDIIAEDHRDQLAQYNLALVLAMAKKFKGSDLDFTDLISEGNMALLRAIDKFNVSKGFKFSTYACRAILKAFSRVGAKHTRYKSLFPTDFDPDMEKSNHVEQKNDAHEDACMSEVLHIFNMNRAELSDVEREVIEHRFPVNRIDEMDDKPMTLEQVGKLIGLTKERVRQIQNKALRKMRDTLEREYLDGTPLHPAKPESN